MSATVICRHSGRPKACPHYPQKQVSFIASRHPVLITRMYRFASLAMMVQARAKQLLHTGLTKILDTFFRTSSDLPVVPTCRTRPSLIARANHMQIRPRPALTEGRIAIVTNVGCGMRWTRQCRRDERHRSRTAKSRGPDIPTLISSGRRCSRIAACDGGKKARLTRESAKETVKTTRAGKAGCFKAYLW
jgi:hypothetical protein